MRFDRLVFNDKNGRYGIKFSDTNLWINDGLCDGEKLCVFDYTIDHWVKEQIIAEPPGNTPESWRLKVTDLRGKELRNTMAHLEEQENT